MTKTRARQVAHTEARGRAISRALLAKSASRGNPSALKHGINAIVANMADAADEAALTLASFPYLDPVQDCRITELYSLTHAQHRRAVIAIEEQGPDPNLVKWETTLGNRLERLLRQLHERNLERKKQAETEVKTVDLTNYTRLPATKE